MTMQNQIDSMETSDHLAHLLAGSVLGQEFSEEDRRRLEGWLAESEEHRALFRRVKSLEMVRDIIHLNKEGYGGKMAARFRQERRKQERGRLVRRWIGWCGGAAALVALAVGIGRTLSVDSVVPSVSVAEQVIVPGEARAVLTLAGGQRVDVSCTEATEEGDIFVDVAGKRVAPTAVKAADTVWHTLTVPAGGEFQYTLSDGTQVWLNSDSELRFPATFSENERRVALRGEAFFDVKKDTCRQFVVALPEGDITVYGTRFVVASYQGSALSAVLVQGSIGFTTPAGRQVRLHPSDRMVYESGSGDIRVEQVDTVLYTSWLKKMFVFRNQPLGEIMTTLSRWYDFDIIFADGELRDIRLSGRLNRYQDVGILLRSYEETAGITFKIDGRNIVISKKRR